MYRISGKLKVKFETRAITDKFRVREFVITDESTQTPQHILFQVAQERCEHLNKIEEGAAVEVSFNVRGREWTDKDDQVRYFNNLNATSVELTK